MEKIQHNINSLSLIFAGFFAVELALVVMAYSMQPFTQPFEILKLIGFLAMIPVSIALLQLCGRYRSPTLLWSSIGLFILHYAMLFFA